MAFNALSILLGFLFFNPLLSFVNTAPLTGLSHQARDILARATPAAPHFVVYGDKWSGTAGPPTVDKIKGFNVYALSFWLLQGPWDKAQEWVSLTDAERAAIKTQYKNAGISLVVSVFGATDVPTTSGADPVATADKIISFVKQYDLDGVDVDYEDFDAINAANGKAETWLVDFTKALRAGLPQGEFILTHAPVAPWFSPKFNGGAYQAVHKQVGNLIDWYNIQFYNQGTEEYTTCDNLLTTSSATWPKSSLFEIADFGVPLNKLVIGKPASTGDANNGYIAPDTLATCLQQAKAKNWNGGVMAWQHPTADAAWIQTVRSKSWPV